MKWTLKIEGFAYKDLVLVVRYLNFYKTLQL